MESELVVWVEEGEVGSVGFALFSRMNELPQEVRWQSYLWRRGTVPVWFRNEMKSSVRLYCDLSDDVSRM